MLGVSYESTKLEGVDRGHTPPVGTTERLHTRPFMVSGGVCTPDRIGSVALETQGESLLPVKRIESVNASMRPSATLWLNELIAICVADDWEFVYAGSHSEYLSSDADARLHLNSVAQGDWPKVSRVVRYAGLAREPYHRLASEEGRNALLFSPFWTYAGESGKTRGIGKLLLSRFEAFCHHFSPQIREIIAADDDHVGTVLRWREYSTNAVVNCEWLARVLAQPKWEPFHYDAIFMGNDPIALGMRMNMHSLGVGRDHAPVFEDPEFLIECEDVINGSADAPGLTGDSNPELCSYRIFVKTEAVDGMYESFRMRAEARLSAVLKAPAIVLYWASHDTRMFHGFPIKSIITRYRAPFLCELDVLGRYVARHLIRLIDLLYRGITLGSGTLNVDTSMWILEPGQLVAMSLGRARWIFEYYLYILYDLSIPITLFDRLARARILTRELIWEAITETVPHAYADYNRMSAALAGHYGGQGQYILSQRCHNMIAKLDVLLTTNVLCNCAVLSSDSPVSYATLALLRPTRDRVRIHTHEEFKKWVERSNWAELMRVMPLVKLEAFLHTAGYIERLPDVQYSEELSIFVARP